MRRVVLLLLIACLACAPRAYRLERTGALETLWPPQITAPSPTCAGPLPDLKADDSERPLFSQLESIDQFRLRLRTCLPPQHADALLTRLIETRPLASPLAFALRYGSFRTSGYLDLRAPFATKVVKPLRRNGATIGFETQYFHVDPAPDGDGSRLTLHAAEQIINDRRIVPATPEPVLTVSPEARYFRLFFLARRSAADHNIALLAAARQDALDLATPAFQQEPAEYCQSPRDRVACTLFPVNTAVGAELRVRVQRDTRYIPLHGRVRDALAASGVADPQRLLARLQVTRPVRGRPRPINFDRTRQDIFELILLGNEHLTW